jgi:hypothetical protein
VKQLGPALSSEELQGACAPAPAAASSRCARSATRTPTGITLSSRRRRHRHQRGSATIRRFGTPTGSGTWPSLSWPTALPEPDLPGLRRPFFSATALRTSRLAIDDWPDPPRPLTALRRSPHSTPLLPCTERRRLCRRDPQGQARLPASRRATDDGCSPPHRLVSTICLLPQPGATGCSRPASLSRCPRLLRRRTPAPPRGEPHCVLRRDPALEGADDRPQTCTKVRRAGARHDWPLPIPSTAPSPPARPATLTPAAPNPAEADGFTLSGFAGCGQGGERPRLWRRGPAPAPRRGSAVVAPARRHPTALGGPH